MRRSAVLSLLEERTAIASFPGREITRELRPQRSPAYSVPHDESARLRAIGRTGLLGTAPDAAFDRITWLAGVIAETPIALMSLLTAQRQWFMSRQGTDMTETRREWSICNHVILGNDLMVVEDVRKDERFRRNPLVSGEPHIRFYAGCPLRSPEGLAVGTLCVIDSMPRRLDDTQKESLRALAEIAEDEIRLHMAERGKRQSP